jgi:hypothetical protein
MSVQTLVLVLVAVAAVLFAVRFFKRWSSYRGDRVITCPENQQTAGVRVDAGHAASTGFVSRPELRLSSCSRWPEHAGCGQECLRQIEASPEACLVRNVLTDWYKDKSCVFCGKPVGEIHWADRKPALLLEKNASIDWDKVEAQDLPVTLAAAKPVCFTCHIANTMVREHPELVVDRSRPA